MHFGNGIINIVCQADEFNKDTDSIEKWICDYIDPNHKRIHNFIKSKIIGRDDLRINDKKPYMVDFYNHDEEIDIESVSFEWNIISDFNDDIQTEYIDNKLYLKIDNYDHIDKTFTLQIIVDDEVNSEMNISVIDMY